MALSQEKEKDASSYGVTCSNRFLRGIPKQHMIILSKYELVEKNKLGVFCSEYGGRAVSLLHQSAESDRKP